MDMEQSLTTELRTINGLNTKVFALTCPENTQTPYVIYTLTGSDRVTDLYGFEKLMEGRYQLDIYHSSYSSLKALKKLIVAKIKSFNFRTLATNGVYCQQVEIATDFDVYENQVSLYKGIIEFNIYYEEE